MPATPSTSVAGPHAVGELLRSGRAVERVVVARGSKSPRLQSIVEECRRRKIPLRFEARESLDRLARAANHQGIVALVSEKRYAGLEEVLRPEPESSLLVVLDGVEDPHNLGAIIRSAHAAGADAVVIPERRSSGATDAVSKAAAGALAYLPLARVKNLARTLAYLKERGYWILGLDERAEITYYDAPYEGRVALVLGGEGKGLHRLTAECCDLLLKIPVAGRIASLNVSVAAGIVLFEALRQRTGKEK